MVILYHNFRNSYCNINTNFTSHTLTKILLAMRELKQMISLDRRLLHYAAKISTPCSSWCGKTKKHPSKSGSETYIFPDIRWTLTFEWVVFHLLRYFRLLPVPISLSAYRILYKNMKSKKSRQEINSRWLCLRGTSAVCYAFCFVAVLTVKIYVANRSFHAICVFRC
jgi:hypothetical protein